MSGGGAWPDAREKLEASQPKKVGRLLRPRLMKVLSSGTAGKSVPLAIWGSRERS